MIIALKILYNSFPGVSQELSWTLTNLTYMASSYLMFHWVKGIPFEFNSGAYDNLNMWEQMDNGDQYTPAKKFLTFVPIVLYVSFPKTPPQIRRLSPSTWQLTLMGRFLLSTHYSHYDVWMFTVNCWALMMVLIPKLPSVRFPRTQIFSNSYSSIECGSLESTSSICHSLPITMINVVLSHTLQFFI